MPERICLYRCKGRYLYILRTTAVQTKTTDDQTLCHRFALYLPPFVEQRDVGATAVQTKSGDR